MTQNHVSGAPAGWYVNGPVERYWDGLCWTPRTRPLSPAIPMQPQPVVVKQTGAGSVAGGILLALLIVFVGIPALLVLGLMMLAAVV